MKYKDLVTEIQRMWNVKAKVIPVIIGATGTVSTSLRQYLSDIPGKHEIKELQKTAVFGTAHLLREVLMSKYRTFIKGNNITCPVGFCKISATLYTLYNCKWPACR